MFVAGLLISSPRLVADSRRVVIGHGSENSRHLPDQDGHCEHHAEEGHGGDEWWDDDSTDHDANDDGDPQIQPTSGSSGAVEPSL